MNSIIRIAVLGIFACLAALLIRKRNPETAMLVSIAAIILAASLTLGGVSEIIDFFRRVGSESGLTGAVFFPILKCTVIAVIAKLSCDICRDAGESGVASAIELAGAVASLLCALPLLAAILQMIGDII